MHRLALLLAVTVGLAPSGCGRRKTPPPNAKVPQPIYALCAEAKWPAALTLVHQSSAGFKKRYYYATTVRADLSGHVEDHDGSAPIVRLFTLPQKRLDKLLATVCDAGLFSIETRPAKIYDAGLTMLAAKLGTHAYEIRTGSDAEVENKDVDRFGNVVDAFAELDKEPTPKTFRASIAFPEKLEHVMLRFGNPGNEPVTRLWLDKVDPASRIDLEVEPGTYAVQIAVGDSKGEASITPSAGGTYKLVMAAGKPRFE